METSFSWCPTGFSTGPTCFSFLPNELKSNVKLYADDTSFFTTVRDKDESANILNNDPLALSKWAYDWKMLSNSDPSKPAQEVLFSIKEKIETHPITSLNNRLKEHPIRNT